VSVYSSTRIPAIHRLPAAIGSYCNHIQGILAYQLADVIIEAGISIGLFTQMGPVKVDIRIPHNSFKKQVKLLFVLILRKVKATPVPSNSARVETTGSP
jgi:hypothetical protein